MGDPPKTPPPFRGCTTRLPQTPISPFKFNASLSKAIPAGNFLIIRGVFEHGAKKIDPVPTVELKHTRRLYLRLAQSLVSLDPKAEPHTDLLHLWIEPLAALGWAVHWAPQIEEKDKRMWVRVGDMFDEPLVETADARKKYDKVITRLHAHFDSSGLQTVNSFRSCSGVIITFALPADVDAAVNECNIVFDSKTLPIYRVRQIEIGYAFELVIGGVAGVDPTAINNVISWFADFERDGESLLDWASMADILTSTDRFSKELADYNLRPPQLLFRLNTTAAWKADSSATNECDTDTKTRLTTINVNLTAVSTLTSALSNCQEELASNQLKLDTLHATTNLITHPGPTIPPPSPSKPSDVPLSPPGLDTRPRSQLDDTTDNPAKRARLSTAPKEGEAVAKNPATDEDYDMQDQLENWPHLLNNKYTIFEEPGVKAENHHLYKWDVTLGIRKGIQVAQHVQITSNFL
ncbi:hypothetical protein B0H10DRAFT_2221013 [Mycena sp. CBHHK59/15]|nr:hypothetical protein B0H10DRAFT_2221013 [Mycena sp. CBHHK59/15]